MCGISGALSLSGVPVRPDDVEGMAATLAHRGPDDRGLFVSDDARYGCGFRRLSIVDLSPAGHQPMTNEDGTVWIVFNGEIYNQADLRHELEQHGHRFRSRSDTEVIVHGYEQWGRAVVERLRGMFAFGVYDVRKRELLLARDHIGVKPLYYSTQSGYLLFASEIKAILRWPGVNAEISPDAMGHYLTLGATPAPQTLFKGISKLAPGHTLTFDASGHSSLIRYWDPVEAAPYEIASTEDGAVEQLRELLSESVRLRMMSDVPVGVFLSGGLDSSLIVALMTRLVDQPINTFSIAIEGDPKSDELTEARYVSGVFKTNHHETRISHREFVDALPAVIHHQDEPLSDPVCVPLYFVSRAARDAGVPVVLAGEGSDELFAGYSDYALLARFHRKYWQPFARLPRGVKSSLYALAAPALPPRRAELMRRAAEGEEMFWGAATAFPELLRRRLMRGDGAGNTHELIRALYEQFDRRRPGAGFLERMTYIEVKHRLPELLLMRVDKMTMAASVEAREPYLDRELTRFALSLPVSLKQRGGTNKYILKKAARGIVPDSVIDRVKMGFCGAASSIVRGALLDHADDVIRSSAWIGETFDRRVVTELLDSHRAGTRDEGMAIWNLLNLALWQARWIESERLAC